MSAFVVVALTGLAGGRFAMCELRLVGGFRPALSGVLSAVSVCGFGLHCPCGVAWCGVRRVGLSGLIHVNQWKEMVMGKKWDQPMCEACWVVKHTVVTSVGVGVEVPVTVRDAPLERCAWCGGLTFIGLHVRADPDGLPFAGVGPND